MSEAILRALMELFAILVKQDQKVNQKHIDYVKQFLQQQLSEVQVNLYYHIFEEKADLIPSSSSNTPEENRSVNDSYLILSICKQLNRTLVLEQKIIVLVRLYELLNIDRNLSNQRMGILNTVSIVFKLDPDDIDLIQNFILSDKPYELTESDILLVDSNSIPQNKTVKHIFSEGLDVPIVIMRISSVDLYFLKYEGCESIYLNGLVLNNKLIYLFAKGSTIKPPKSKPIFYSDVAAQFMKDFHTNNFCLEVENLEYRFPNGHIGLQDVSFSENQGKLVGIMGASGAGKTTLLNVLCGLEEPFKGQVLINNINLHTQREEVQSVIGYIPQDDLLIEELTVFENLFFNAKFCFKDKSDEELSCIVQKTLLSLGLLETQNLKVGSSMNKTISGGQRKRLNIALELIREPSILFVDEPTSGLSSRDSENVMDLLRELTLKGQLVIVVIHQPSSDIYKMFDKMLILDTGGFMIYYGNPVEALSYFKKTDNQVNSDAGECPKCGTVNPELIFNIIESKVIDEYGNYTPHRKTPPKRWEELFNERCKKDYAIKSDSPLPKILNIPGWFEQFSIYLKRDVLSKISNKQYIILNLLEAPILAFILSFIIRYIVDPNSKEYIFRENENIPIYIFMSLIVALFLGLTVSAEEIFRDRKILRREAFLNLHRSSYLFSKITVLFTISAIQTFLFIIIANSILGIKGMYFDYWFALFTTAAFANMLGLNISSTFNSAVTIYIVIPLLMIPMMVLSGAMFSFEKLNRSVTTIGRTPLIADFMPTKWSYEALMVNQFKNNLYAKSFYEVDKLQSQSDFKQVYYIPELERLLKECEIEFLKTGTLKNTTKEFQIIKNELNKQFELVSQIEFGNAAELHQDNISKELFVSISNYLVRLRNYYSYIFMKSAQHKEDIVRQLISKDFNAFQKLKDDYFNESISDIVTKVFEKNKLLEYKGHLIQHSDPIYMDPVPAHALNVRTHFMAPVKKFLGGTYDTFWFNMIFIWLYSCLLYLALYFETIRFLFISTEKFLKKKKS